MRFNCTSYPPKESISLFCKVDEKEEEESDDAITRQKGRPPTPSVFLHPVYSYTQCVPTEEMMAKPGVEQRGVGSAAMCLLYILLLQYITVAKYYCCYILLLQCFMYASVALVTFYCCNILLLQCIMYARVATVR